MKGAAQYKCSSIRATLIGPVPHFLNHTEHGIWLAGFVDHSPVQLNEVGQCLFQKAVLRSFRSVQIHKPNQHKNTSTDYSPTVLHFGVAAKEELRIG